MDARRRRDRANEIYSKISARIRNFDLHPGERLTEARISEQFGVSRTPVREALRLLNEGGLVVASEDSRGYVVRSLDLAAVAKIYSVRKVLETLAVELAMPRVSTDAFGQFMMQVKAASERGGVQEQSAMREAFHEQLAMFTENEVLCKFLREINNRIFWTRRLDLSVPGQFREEAQREHYQILRRMADGRVDEAKRLMNRHIATSEATITALLNSGRQVVVVARHEGADGSLDRR